MIRLVGWAKHGDISLSVYLSVSIPYVSNLKGRTHEMKRGRRRPLGANMAVACRIGPAAACLHSSAFQGEFSRASLRAPGISASSAAVKKRPHAVCAEAFVMPCKSHAARKSEMLPGRCADSAVHCSISSLWHYMVLTMLEFLPIISSLACLSGCHLVSNVLNKWA